MPSTTPAPLKTVHSSKMEPDAPRNPVDRKPAIKQSILRYLGHPPNLHKINVTSVNGDNYRITIYCHRFNKLLLMGMENYIAHTMFVKVDENGEILESNPPITKLYE